MSLLKRHAVVVALTAACVGTDAFAPIIGPASQPRALQTLSRGGRHVGFGGSRVALAAARDGDEEGRPQSSFSSFSLGDLIGDAWPWGKGAKDKDTDAASAAVVPAKAAASGPRKMPRADLTKDRDLAAVFENNREWVAAMVAKDGEYFSRLAKGQDPKILWIGCSDARVPADRIMGLDTGEVFVARNVANVVSHMDIALMSVLQYAVETLEVPHIVVCGHYDCGGVRASLVNKDHRPPLEQWLRNIRDVERIHADELRAIPDKEKRARRLVELNVIEQCLNLFKTGIVQRRRVATYAGRRNYGTGPGASKLFTEPRIHPFVFDPADGVLRELSVDLTAALRQLGDIYSLYAYDSSCDQPGIEAKGPEASKGPDANVGNASSASADKASTGAAPSQGADV